MKTSAIKIGSSYLLDNIHDVTVVERIPGRLTTKPNMHSGIMFTGYKREQKRFRLDNNLIVKANRLYEK